MRNRIFAAALGAVALCVAVPVAAQTPAPSASAPLVNLWYVGGFTGAAAAEKFGGMVGAEGGIRTWRNLDVIAELGWFQNAVNKTTSDATAPLVTYLQTTQNQPASAEVKAPTIFATIGGRWVFEGESKIRPYIIAAVGGARVDIKSTFTLAGTDITSTLPQYGVTLGEDLTGHSSHPAVTVGGGVLMPYGQWYVDAGYRLTSIATDGQATNVNRLNIGFGIRF